MSKTILEKLDILGQELDVLEKNLVEKRSNTSNKSQESNSENEVLRKSLKAEQVKNKKAEDIISRNILKLERVIEKEEKNNA